MAGAAAIAAAPKQKVRAKRGQATDPHSIAERVISSRLFFSHYQNCSFVELVMGMNYGYECFGGDS